MLGGEHRRSDVYASCLEALKKLETCSFCFKGFKDKNTLRGFIQGSKTRNNLQRRYLQIKKEEAADDSQISSLNCKKHCTRDVFREWNKSNVVRLIYWQVLKNGQRKKCQKCEKCQKNGTNKVLKVKQTTSKVLILLWDGKAPL